MKLQALAFFLATASTASLAQDTCGLQVAKLLSSGNTSKISELFTAVDPKVVSQLADVVQKAGALSDLIQAEQPRFKNHVRYSVLASGQAPNFSFTSYRVNATSALLGPVQVQVAVQERTGCKILAIYLDTQP